jgi:hypothetical protein
MSPPPAPDRRAHPRYLCWVEVLCGAGEQPHRPARVLDLSTVGARVALLAPLPDGADLRLTLPQGEGRPSVLDATVNRVSRTRSGWEAGCTFTRPLTEDQLAALVGPPGASGVDAGESGSVVLPPAAPSSRTQRSRINDRDTASA